MRIVTRWLKRVGSRAVDRDLQAEVQFHIDMRIETYVNAGMTTREAEALARKQFGDVEEAMNGMRRARLRSPRAALIAVASASLIVAGLWLYTVSLPSAPVLFPQLPAVPPLSRVEKRIPPPPPPPPPTWDEFVAKVNTFGDSGGAKSGRR